MLHSSSCFPLSSLSALLISSFFRSLSPKKKNQAYPFVQLYGSTTAEEHSELSFRKRHRRENPTRYPFSLPSLVFLFSSPPSFSRFSFPYTSLMHEELAMARGSADVVTLLRLAQLARDEAQEGAQAFEESFADALRQFARDARETNK